MNFEDLSLEQQYAFRMFQKGNNLFITGPGGVGKTKLIQSLVEDAISKKKKIQVCALTGCAAILLNCGARTIHSWSGIKLARGDKSTIIQSVLRNKRLTNSWRTTQVLIIDEISMMSRKVFDILEELARIIRRNADPFGGLQLIFTGDFFQLPPVGTYGEPETEQFCFESERWQRVFTPQNHIELTTIFRQKDPVYCKVLNEIRKGRITAETKRILQAKVGVKYAEESDDGIIPTKIFPIRSKVDFINNTMFSRITEPEQVFNCIVQTNNVSFHDSEKPIPIEVLVECAKLSKEDIENETKQLIQNSQCVQVLRLKKGANVMCTSNIDMENGIFNGAQGIVIDFTNVDKHPIVRFRNGIVKHMELHLVQHEEYPIISVGQYPLVLSWAMTIHKIQGATLPKAEIDIGASIFEFGQTYVALSRVQSLEGLYLTSFDPYKIKTNQIVIDFYNSFVQIDFREELDRMNSQMTPGRTEVTDLVFEEFEYKESVLNTGECLDISSTTVKVVRL